MSEYVKSPIPNARVLAGVAALAVGLTACGGAGEAQTPVPLAATSEAPAVQPIATVTETITVIPSPSVATSPDGLVIEEQPLPSPSLEVSEEPRSLRCEFAKGPRAHPGQMVVMQDGISHINGNWYGRLVLTPDGSGSYDLNRMYYAEDSGNGYYALMKDSVNWPTDEIFFATPKAGKPAAQKEWAATNTCPLPAWVKELPPNVRKYLRVAKLQGQVAIQGEGVSGASWKSGRSQAPSRLVAYQRFGLVGLNLGSGIKPKELGMRQVRP